MKQKKSAITKAKKDFLESQTKKARSKNLAPNTYQHLYAHYCFECELHPDEDPEGLMEDINARNFDF